MRFDEQLNYYIKEINCSAKELSEKSKISTSVISRFRTGKKNPNIKTLQLKKLSEGIAKIAKEKGLKYDENEVYKSFIETLDTSIDITLLRNNLNNLINTLNINSTTLANNLGYSLSLISKIRSGKRNPYKPQIFANNICRYIVNAYKGEEDKRKIATLLNCTLEEIKTDVDYYNKLVEYLSVELEPISNSIDKFLTYLDSFNLEDYIKLVHFDKMKVPHIPIYKVGAKEYYGTEEAKQGEIDFFKATILSKSSKPIFMCCDMPMEDMAQDIEFSKKWMYSIALSLKKGLHLNIVHNLNRPFKEMLLGLEGWIPLYMTGQVSPYYIKNYRDNVYCHLNYVSGSVALTR